VLVTLQRLHPEILSSADLIGRFALSRSQIGSILTGLIATGSVRRVGGGSGSRYVALEGLPESRRIGIRPRRLGFGAEWRRRYLASQAVGPEVPDEGPAPAAEEA
jgi:hypothetical protein